MNEPKLRFPEFTGAWEQHKLGDTIPVVTDYVAAGSFADIAANVDYKSKPDYAQLVRTVDLKHNFENNDSIYVDKKAFDYLYRVNLDDESIVLPNIGANIGEVYYIEPSELPYKRNVLGPNAIYLKPCKNTKFIYSLFQTVDFQKKLMISIASSGQPKFNKTELKEIMITLPNNDEQTKIGACFANLDNLIQSAEKELEGYRELKQGMLQKMFPKKGEKVPEIRFPEFTGDWEQYKLNEVIEGVSKKNTDGLYTQDDILACSLGTELDRKTIFYGLRSTEDSIKSYRIVDIGNVIFTKSPIKGYPNGIVRTCKIVDGIVPSLYCVYKKKKNISIPIDTRFIQSYLEDKERLDRYLCPLVNVGARNNVNITDKEFLEGTIKIPTTIEEQAKIVDTLEKINSLINLHQQELNGYKELKKGLLQQMFC